MTEGLNPSEIRPFAELAFAQEGTAPLDHGAEKAIYRMHDQERVIAAKIFTDIAIIDGLTVVQDVTTKAAKALKEYQLYKRYKQTPVLSIFVPDAYYLLADEEGHVNGIGIAWIDGIVLSKVENPHVLTAKEIDTLAHAFTQAPYYGIFPDPDMVIAENLLVTAFESSHENRLFLSECGELSVKERGMYDRYITNYMRMLREDYL